MQAHRLLGDVRQPNPFLFIDDTAIIMFDSVTLIDGETTAAEQTLIEGASLANNILNLLKTDHPGLSRRSQLTLDSATAVIQYKEATQTLTDFTDTDIKFPGYTYHGEHADDAAAGDVSSHQFIYFRTSDLSWRGVSNNTGGTTWGNFAQNEGLLQPTTWLSSLSDSEISSYFDTNTYDATRNYYVYEQSSGQVRKITRTETWQTLAADAEYDEVSGSELTLNSDNLLSNLRLTIALAQDSISADKPDWRAKIDLVHGSVTYTLYILLNLENSDRDLSELTSPQAAQSQSFREGASERILDIEALIDGMDTDTWEFYSINSAAVKVQNSDDSGATWIDMTALGFEGLLPSEYTINTSRLVSNHELGFRIHSNAISDNISLDGANRLRFLITIGDSNMTQIQVAVPFAAESLLSLSSLAAMTNATARTHREGASIATFSLVDLIAGLSAWSDIHLDSAGAVVQFSDDSGATWEEHTTTQAGLAIGERTLNTTDLLANGNIGFRLHADSIELELPHDGTNRFRIYATLTESGVNRYVSIPLNLLAPVALSSLAALTTAAAQTYREGAVQTVHDITSFITGISDRNDINLESATAKVQNSDDSGATWIDMTALGFEGLLPSEYTLDTDDLLSMLELGFRIHSNAIDMNISHDGVNRLRILITFDDGLS